MKSLVRIHDANYRLQKISKGSETLIFIILNENRIKRTVQLTKLEKKKELTRMSESEARYQVSEEFFLSYFIM